MGICPDYRNNVRSDHIFMDRLAKLWVGKRSHRKYDHNWIKKRENYDSLPKGFSFEFPISLNHLKKIPDNLTFNFEWTEYLSTMYYFPSNRKMSVLKVFSLAFKLAYFYVASCNLTIPQFIEKAVKLSKWVSVNATMIFCIFEQC